MAVKLTAALTLGPLRLFCPPWVQGPLTQEALPVMYHAGGHALWILSEAKLLRLELWRTHTGTILGWSFGTYPALRPTSTERSGARDTLSPLHRDLEVPGEFLTIGFFDS